MSQPVPPRNFLRRLLVAVVVGVVVAVVAYLSAFNFLRTAFLIHSPAWMTQHELKSLAETIKGHKEEKGHFPAHLTDIERLKEAFKHDADGRLIDRWDHPIQYSTTEDGFTLFSFGQDGQPGGEGDDADVYHDRPLAPPSFHRFTFELPTGAVRWACVLTGIGAAVIVARPSCKSWGELLARAVATTIGAIFVAFIISVIHIPSGH